MDGLPDEILISIISLLPFHEAVGTSVMAKRFHEFWRYVSRVEIDTHQIIKKYYCLRRTAQNCPEAWWINICDFCTVDNWIQRLTKHCIEEFTLVWKPIFNVTDPELLTMCAFSCPILRRLSSVRNMGFGHKLKKLELNGLKVAEQINICFPNLDILVLQHVVWHPYCRLVIETPKLKVFQADCVCHLRDKEIRRIMQSSKLLTDVSIQSCPKLSKVKICGVKLRVLKLGGMALAKIEVCAKDLSVLVLASISCSVEHMLINAPTLVEFRSYGERAKYYNMGRCLRPADILKRYPGFLQSQRKRRCLITLENLRTLSIDLYFNNLTDANILANILAFCNRLENLEITAQEKKSIFHQRIAYSWWEQVCSSSNLKTLEIRGFQTKVLKYNFFECLMTKPRFLEKIILQFYDKSSQEDTDANNELLFRLSGAASKKNVSIIFKSYC